MGQKLGKILRGSCVGTSAKTVIETAHSQLSPQQFLGLFLSFLASDLEPNLESECAFLQQSFWHLALCSVVSFEQLFLPPQAHAQAVGAVVKTSNNRQWSDMEAMNFIF